MTARERNKGAAAEREVVNLAKAHGFPAQRTFSQLDGDRCDVTGVPGHAIEVKRQERLNIWAAIEQARESAGLDTPVVAFRRNGSDWYAALPLEQLLELIQHAEPHLITKREQR